MLTPVHCKTETFGSGREGHAFLPAPDTERAGRYAGSAQLVLIDRPAAASSLFRWKAGAGDWLTDRSSLSLRINHNTSDGMEEYLSRLERDLKAAHGLLGPAGSVYVFSDQRASAHVRLLLDAAFGRSNFLNEIIWAREVGLRPAGHFTRSHDTIFLYRKGGRALFNVKAAGRMRGSLKSHMKRGVEGGRPYYTRTSAGRVYRYYEDDIVSIGDVWADIPEIAPKDEERLGWEGQRPLALVERMISASSNPGGLVCGMVSASGTIAEAAERLGRRALLIGSSAPERLLARRRLLLSGAGGYEFECSGETHEREPLVEAEISGNSVRLHAYKLPGSPPVPQGTLLKDGLGSLEYWAAGRFMDGVFRMNNWAMRTRERPILSQALEVGDGEGKPCIHLVDAGGEEWFFY
jgi:hypothetical protein